MSHRFRLLGAALLVVALCLVVSTGRAAEAASDSALGWVGDTVWRGHQGGINAVAVSPDGSLLITGDSEGVVRVWDVAEGRSRSYRGHSGSVLDVAFDPSGRFAVSSGADKAVRVWSLDRVKITGRPVRVRSIATHGA